MIVKLIVQMILKLKMCTAGNILGKNCLKTIRDTFFPNMWSAIKRDEVGHEEES